MNKKQINEKQLLTEASAWFKQKYGKSPKECGVKFIKVWHKPTPLVKTTAVVFTSSAEIGEAFIWEQNIIFRCMGNCWIIGLCLFAFIYALAKPDDEIAKTIIIFFSSLYCCAMLLCLALARKCKKLEKVHNWDVEVYYPRKP